MEKIPLKGLFRDNPDTPEGKYLVKRRDGTVPDWPHFVLGGRDPHAAVALRAYADSSSKDPNCDPDYVKRLYVWADRFDKYRELHGSGDPHMGKHRVDDPATIEEMKLGFSA